MSFPPKLHPAPRSCFRLVRAVLLVVSGVIVSGVLGCGLEESGPESAFKVALLTPGSIRDAGWNQSAYEGLERIRDETGAEIAHQETKTPQDFEAGFRDFAARGFGLIFGHGFEFQDAAAKVAIEYPDTIFITTSGSTVRRNVSPIVFELEQATFVLGYLGGRLARDSKIGAIGGVKIPSVASTFYAFEGGGKLARKHTDLKISYIGNWTDASAAREATLAQISTGVDMLIHNANEAARGFFQAVEENPKVFAFGTNKNQNDLAPTSILASATLDVPGALLLVAREVRSGQFYPRSIRFGLRDGVVRIEWNDALRSRIPDPVWDGVQKLIADV
ncbi:MAG: BMP family ABC transporter substrate-binding protein, partial [bacterium]|nr:BMP family ABC transporter substrate-binding protein [bacterium]